MMISIYNIPFIQNMMSFCGKCSNLLYESIQDNNLIHVCKVCSYEKPVNTSTPTVYKKFYSQDFLTQSFVTNPYTHLDTTLPRLRNKKCINNSCETNTEEFIFECKYISEEEFKKELSLRSPKETFTFTKIKELNSFNDHWLGTISKEQFNTLFPETTELHLKQNIQKGNYRIDFLCKPYENDILYVKYDDKNMKFMYICCCCQTSWKNN